MAAYRLPLRIKLPHFHISATPPPPKLSRKINAVSNNAFQHTNVSQYHSISGKQYKTSLCMNYSSNRNGSSQKNSNLHPSLMSDALLDGEEDDSISKESKDYFDENETDLTSEGTHSFGSNIHNSGICSESPFNINNETESVAFDDWISTDLNTEDISRSSSNSENQNVENSDFALASDYNDDSWTLPSQNQDDAVGVDETSQIEEGEEITSYTHSQFDDDFVAGTYDVEYLDDLVQSVNPVLNRIEECLVEMKIKTVHLPFQTNTSNEIDEDLTMESLEEVSDEEFDKLISDGISEKHLQIGPLLESNELTNGTVKDIGILSQKDLGNVSESSVCEKQSVFELDMDQLVKIKPLPPRISCLGFADYVNHSEMLQKLVEMGIDLHYISQDPSLANQVLRLNLSNDVMPRLLFLTDHGVVDTEIAGVINKNPWILVEKMEDMKIRVDYFKSKRFSRQAVRNILVETPELLTTPVRLTDKMLGFIMSEFGLLPSRVRQLVGSYPRIMLVRQQCILEVHRALKSCCEFSPAEIRHILLTHPPLFTVHYDRALSSYHYITVYMGIPHEQLLKHPKALYTPLNHLKWRFKALQAVDRVQFDPTKPNFVTLETFASSKFESYYRDVLKIPREKAMQFLKTL